MNTTQAILAHLEDHGPATQRQLEAALSIEWNVARNAITGLMRNYRIEQKGEKRESHIGRAQVIWAIRTSPPPVKPLIELAMRSRTPLERAWHA